jgi:hypothetical protein
MDRNCVANKEIKKQTIHNSYHELVFLLKKFFGLKKILEQNNNQTYKWGAAIP